MASRFSISRRRSKEGIDIKGAAKEATKVDMASRFSISRRRSKEGIDIKGAAKEATKVDMASRFSISRRRSKEGIDIRGAAKEATKDASIKEGKRGSISIFQFKKNKRNSEKKAENVSSSSSSDNTDGGDDQCHAQEPLQEAMNQQSAEDGEQKISPPQGAEDDRRLQLQKQLTDKRLKLKSLSCKALSCSSIAAAENDRRKRFSMQKQLSVPCNSRSTRSLTSKVELLIDNNANFKKALESLRQSIAITDDEEKTDDDDSSTSSSQISQMEEYEIYEKPVYDENNDDDDDDDSSFCSSTCEETEEGEAEKIPVAATPPVEAAMFKMEDAV